MILPKKQMTEEDIKLNYITPAILTHWQNKVTMETQITDGRVNIRGNIITRDRPKKADYVLWLNRGKPIAVVEAKDNNHPVSYGLQQAITYAQMMDVPFAYSSNGDGFREHDFLTGLERDLDLDEFPSPDELISRWEMNANGGEGTNGGDRAGGAGFLRQPGGPLRAGAAERLGPPGAGERGRARVLCPRQP